MHLNQKSNKPTRITVRFSDNKAVGSEAHFALCMLGAHDGLMCIKKQLQADVVAGENLHYSIPTVVH